jgi:hypothetical protein
MQLQRVCHNTLPVAYLFLVGRHSSLLRARVLGKQALPQLGRAHRLAAMFPLLIVFLVVTVLVQVYRWFYES